LTYYEGKIDAELLAEDGEETENSGKVKYLDNGREKM